MKRRPQRPSAPAPAPQPDVQSRPSTSWIHRRRPKGISSDVAPYIHDKFEKVPGHCDEFASAPLEIQIQVLAHLHERAERRRSGFGSAATAMLGSGALALVVLWSTWVTTIGSGLFTAVIRSSDPATGKFTPVGQQLAGLLNRFESLYLMLALIGAGALLLAFVAAKASDRLRAASVAWIYAYEQTRQRPAKRIWPARLRRALGFGDHVD